MADGLIAASIGVGAGWMQSVALDAWTMFAAWVIDGYARAPALMAGLALLALVPPLALIGLTVNVVGTLAKRQSQSLDVEPMRTVMASALGLGRPRQGWLVLEGTEQARRPLPREMVSFGREEDNDIRLEHATVHRHHAVLHRTPDAHFVIRDLSGPAGNGVKVNGERVAQRSLVDGDRIEIGAVAIKFEARHA